MIEEELDFFDIIESEVDLTEHEIETLVKEFSVDKEGFMHFSDEFWRLFNKGLGKTGHKLKYLHSPWTTLPRSNIPVNSYTFKMKHSAIRVKLPKLPFRCGDWGHVIYSGWKCKNCGQDVRRVLSPEKMYEEMRRALLDNELKLRHIKSEMMSVEDENNVKDFLKKYREVINFLIGVNSL